MSDLTELSSGQRNKAQRAAILRNLFAPIMFYIIAGEMMQIYVSDVLHFKPKRIATILAFLPLVHLCKLLLLSFIQKFGKVRTLVVSDIMRLVIILALLLIPSGFFREVFWLYLLLLFLFHLVIQLGAGLVWQPILREITTEENRGDFFGKNRFLFTTMSVIGTGFISFFIDKEITDTQYKVLLGLCLFGILNAIFWERKIPELRGASDVAGSRKSLFNFSKLWEVFKKSPVLKRPLLILILLSLCEFPMLIVYFRQVLNIPANILSLFVFMSGLGAWLSLLFWGKLSDSIGFKPVLMGVLILSVIFSPLILLVAPFPENYMSLASLEMRGYISLGALLFSGFVGGAFGAGVGIATTSIQHYFVNRDDSLEALTLLTFFLGIFGGAFAIAGGIFLEDYVIPSKGSHHLDTLVYFDSVKAYLAIFSPLLKIIVVFVIIKLPNARPYFGVSHFFSSIITSPVRTIYAQKDLYDESENRRLELAHWLGQRINPISLTPLIELLHDPSYDVKVEAIRSLARTKSPQAGKALFEVLEDNEQRHIADHVTWALGELRYAPAFELIKSHLVLGTPTRIRAMSARALGKLGGRKAIEPIADILKKEPESLHLTSSCCRALLWLNATEQSEIVIRNLSRLTSREERYDLLDIICSWLKIQSEWLLRSSSMSSSWESLHKQIDMMPDAWQDDNSEVIDAFTKKDHLRIQRLYAEALEKEHHLDEVAHSLGVVLNELNEWQILSVLASSWLLFKPMHK